MKPTVLSCSVALAVALLAPAVLAGQAVDRSSTAPPSSPSGAGTDLAAPAEWVSGSPGQMVVMGRECRSLPEELIRRRVVDVAIREWAFFGYPVLDRVEGRRLPPPGSSAVGRVAFEHTTGRVSGLNAGESERLAAPIAGYWAVTPEGRGIIDIQNRRWTTNGVAARWNAPWSAAFISWVMCEGGLGTNDRFRRAIAHWTYIDQAIRARDGQAPQAAFVAYDIGERPVHPGDLLCQGRRPAYRSLDERRRQMGAGASSHCDIVVAVDAAGERILAIGGNVLRSVSLKILPGRRDDEGRVRARSTSSARIFAHLQLRADPIGLNGLAASPALASLACASTSPVPLRGAQVLALLQVEGPWNGSMADAAASVSSGAPADEIGLPAPSC